MLVWVINIPYQKVIDGTFYETDSDINTTTSRLRNLSLHFSFTFYIQCMDLSLEVTQRIITVFENFVLSSILFSGFISVIVIEYCIRLRCTVHSLFISVFSCIVGVSVFPFCPMFLHPLPHIIREFFLLQIAPSRASQCGSDIRGVLLLSFQVYSARRLLYAIGHLV